MSRPRLSQDELQRLAEAMIDEVSTLAKAAPPTLSSAVRLRTSKPHVASWRRKKARVTEWFAEAAALDAQTAELELEAVRAQVSQLMLLALFAGDARAWTNGAKLGSTIDQPQEIDPRRWARYHDAVKALTDFYFGGARDDHNLLAETQLAWIATRKPVLRKSTREARRRAYGRYSELWDLWAKWTHADARGSNPDE